VTLVADALPGVPEPDRTALALVGLARIPRRQVAVRLGRDEAELSCSLARARKELRRTVAALGGSGWCELAERLISDRMDGALADGDGVRLDVHLRNCPRCVEHDRGLVRATDALVATATGAAFAFAAPEATGAKRPEAAAPAAGDAGAEPANDAVAPSSFLRALPLQALIAVSVLLALAALVLAAVALGLQL
jgi:hypothetical protein